MAKKKGKNSNYKANFTAQEAADKKKNAIILTVGILISVLLLGSIIAAIVISSNAPDNGGAGEETVYGKIVIKVDFEEAPITSENFMELVNDGFYDGLTIFRAQKDFVIQGGKNDAVNLEPIVGEFAENGYDNDITHNRGVISMARTKDPDSATSQFFIVLDDGAKSSLDEKYAGFGYVVEGMDVVDKIAEALMKCESDYMGFVADKDAITIEYAKEITDYAGADGSNAKYVEMYFVGNKK